jgi:hypothetical protein
MVTESPSLSRWLSSSFRSCCTAARAIPHHACICRPTIAPSLPDRIGREWATVLRTRVPSALMKVTVFMSLKTWV